jgi:hypothetical protein
MPLITIVEPPAVSEVRPLVGAEWAPSAQGTEGRQVAEEIEKVSRHWNMRSQSEATTAEEIDIVEELTYDLPPPKAVKTARVKYRFVGKGRPLPFEFDQ